MNRERGSVDFTIRNETERDFRKVEELTREAFWNLYVPGCSEHYLVHRMRSHPDFLKELDFVAELDGMIIGNIMYTRAWLVGDDGQEMEIASFGPVSVLPVHQRKGIGSALIGHTVDIARREGTRAVVIFGDPHNYCRLGFSSCRDHGISDMNGEYPYGMLGLVLEEGVLGGRKWKLRLSDLYNVDEKEAEAFDAGFARKEKGYRHTQDIFSIAVRSYVR
jgi:putative acetyltransferase